MKTMCDCIVVCLGLASGLSAQSPTQAQLVIEVAGTVTQEVFGEPGIVPLRDVDGDGVSDFAAAGHSSSGGPGIQHVAAYSGATGAQLWDVLASSAGLGFASLVTGGGDVDGDGVWDVLAWNPGGASAVHVLSGASGALLRIHQGSGIGYGMQCPGAIFGDADGDGFDDYLIADNFGSTITGQAYVISGRTGATWLTLTGTAARERDWSTGLGDVDGDGFDDFAVWQQACGGLAAVVCPGTIKGYSGRNGAILYSVSGVQWQNLGFHGARCGGGDMSGDGIGDFVTSGFIGNGGVVQAFSGVDGSLLWQRWGAGVDAIGATIALGDDWNSDGRVDVMTIGSLPARWLVLSGADGAEITATPLPSPSLVFGINAYLFDDVTGDGSREVLSRGGRQNPFWLPPHPGSVFISSHATGPLSYWVERGRACPASNGSLPRARLLQDPSLGSLAQLRLRGTVPGAQPVLVLGLPFPTGVDFEWVSGCHLYLNPVSALLVSPTDANGMAGVDLPVPAAPSLAGLKLGLQWFILDQLANPSGVIGSTAVDMILGS